MKTAARSFKDEALLMDGQLRRNVKINPINLKCTKSVPICHKLFTTVM
jgi:hypothetical protein